MDIVLENVRDDGVGLKKVLRVWLAFMSRRWEVSLGEANVDTCETTRVYIPVGSRRCEPNVRIRWCMTETVSDD